MKNIFSPQYAQVNVYTDFLISSFQVTFCTTASNDIRSSILLQRDHHTICDTMSNNNGTYEYRHRYENMIFYLKV